MSNRRSAGFFLFLLAVVALAGCSGTPEQPAAPPGPAALKEVPSVRLNYRYEPDVPPPADNRRAAAEERSPAVQADFDNNRIEELLDKTVTSPDGKRVAAVYHRPSDRLAEFRLDMYASDGRLLKKISADAMGVQFPDTIVWSPDSGTVAFMAKTRTVDDPMTMPSPANGPTASTPSPSPSANANSNANEGQPTGDPEANANAGLPAAAPTPAAPANVLTFRTEQIYTVNAEGEGLKPLTQNEGLIYFYFVWSPDSTMLAALAATGREWQVLEARADQMKEQFVPLGRPRVIEKNGRERRLDDGLTAVQPVWSPDSAKIACAFNDQVRIYDSRGDTPTQAAILLRNSLLLSSQAYDRDQATKLNVDPANVNTNTAANSNVNGNANANVPATNLPPSALPDPNTLVSFNPIISLNWLTEDQLYFQTAFVKRFKNESDSLMSYARWHRLILTPQPSVLGR